MKINLLSCIVTEHNADNSITAKHTGGDSLNVLHIKNNPDNHLYAAELLVKKMNRVTPKVQIALLPNAGAFQADNMIVWQYKVI